MVEGQSAASRSAKLTQPRRCARAKGATLRWSRNTRFRRACTDMAQKPKGGIWVCFEGLIRAPDAEQTGPVWITQIRKQSSSKKLGAAEYEGSWSNTGSTVAMALGIRALLAYRSAKQPRFAVRVNWERATVS